MLDVILKRSTQLTYAVAPRCWLARPRIEAVATLEQLLSIPSDLSAA